MIPQLSPTPWTTTVAPLLFVLVLNGMKVTKSAGPCAGVSPALPSRFALTHLVRCPAVLSAQELLDDVRRHRSDSVVNHRLVTVLRASGEVQARWQELRVGDVVKVRWQLPP
jgi:magnesium-transporting ATPase (P-type)